MKKKYPEISLMNVLFCLLVVFIHVSSAPVTTLDKTSWQFAAVYIPSRLSAFVVQGFIFLSGLKLYLNFDSKRDYKSFYKSRFLKILIPYIIWNIIYYTYFMYQFKYELSVQKFLYYFFTGTLVSPFYFIIIIVQFYLLVPLFDKILPKCLPALAIVVSLLVTVILKQYLPTILSGVFHGYQFQYNDRVFTTYFIYWVGGCLAGLIYEKFKVMLYKYKILITALFTVLALADGIFSYLSVTGIMILNSLELIHFCYCCFAILLLSLVFSLFYEKRTQKSKVIKDIDSSSYYIYLAHCLPIYIVNEMMVNAGITRISETYVIRIVFVYTITLICCIAYAKLKKISL